MSAVPIHLAFPDGVLRYDCVACDQRCCKTGGLAVFPAERDALIRVHPALELVAPSGSDSIEVFTTPPSGCWFLRGERCGLIGPRDSIPGDEVAPTPRPRACSLFPFNLFGSLGDALVVAPNGLCPLEVAPGAGVTHGEVLAALGELGAAGAPPGELRAADAGTLPLERRIRDAASASCAEPSPIPLLAFAELATAAHRAGDVDHLDLARLPETIDALCGAGEELAAIVGIEIPGAPSWAAIAPTLAAWTPALRLFAWDGIALERLPRAMLALALYLAHWQGMRPGRRLLPQSLMQMVSSLGPTLELLACWDLPWRGAPVDGAVFTTDKSPAGARRDLGELDATDPFARTRLLRRLAAAQRSIS